MSTQHSRHWAFEAWCGELGPFLRLWSLSSAFLTTSSTRRLAGRTAHAGVRPKHTIENGDDAGLGALRLGAPPGGEELTAHGQPRLAGVRSGGAGCSAPWEAARSAARRKASLFTRRTAAFRKRLAHPIEMSSAAAATAGVAPEGVARRGADSASIVSMLRTSSAVAFSSASPSSSLLLLLPLARLRRKVFAHPDRPPGGLAPTAHPDNLQHGQRRQPPGLQW